MSDVEMSFGVDGLHDFAVKLLREHINTALFESDALKHTSLALGVLGVVAKAGYRDTAMPGNFCTGTMVEGAPPNRAVVCETAMKLWEKSKDMDDQDDGETAESVVRRGIAVLCCNFPVFGQEFAISMLGEEGVKIKLRKKFGKN
jgi:hypothetical protein